MVDKERGMKGRNTGTDEEVTLGVKDKVKSCFGVLGPGYGCVGDMCPIGGRLEYHGEWAIWTPLQHLGVWTCARLLASSLAPCYEAS